ncbi:ABC transporter permease [Streptomyces sp. adm13(2018)]|uniref:FtsX-like permease family protein n=1 Tax=Streptomyces sp. adm13(2018) TaxID=2479007 RepID=UPI0011CDDB13|nr:FtsX-like permease family protein [Streptomyces sp. adm13(2018)]TXS14971.1 ABC transporter permease [Streptomyces sp. adm13(2018)]
MPRSPRSEKPARAVAPWVRTRLRTAPWAAASLALLVLVTAYLAAVLPRAVDAYETEGLRHDIRTAAPRSSVLELTAEPPGLELPPSVREAGLAPAVLGKQRDRAGALLPAPLRTDPGQTVHGVRTVKRVEGLDPWLPRPDGISPELVLASLSGLAEHTTLRAGRLPAGTARAPEAVVTTKTAEALRIKPGSVVHVPGRVSAVPLALTVTGIVEPRGPEGPYWAVEPLLRTPALAPLVSQEVTYYWQGALLLSPTSAPALLSTTGEPEVYFRYLPTADHLTGRDAGRLGAALASASGGPDLVRLREVVGPTGALTTELDTIVGAYGSMRGAIDPVVAVAVFGIGAVAAVVLAMTGGLFVARRDGELALIRSRGASLTGIGLRLLGETSAVAVPAALLALVLAVATARGPDGASGGVLGGIPLLPSVLATIAVALVAMLVLPLRAVVRHRRPRLHGGRDDLLTARPSRRRTVLELTLLVLAVSAVASLRLRGTGDSGDHLVSAAPVLVGLIAALVLVRVYPLPLRWAARPARRLRGAVGPLALARAGRASSAGTLPLLALVLALTTAAFGGSVLAGVADARDRAALLATGADARIDGTVEWTPLPAGLAEAVRTTPGVRDVAPLQIEYGVSLPSPGSDTAQPMSSALVGVEPDAYTRLARRTGFGPFPAALLATTGKGGKEAAADTARVLPAIASPSVAARLGSAPQEIVSAAGVFRVRIVAVRPTTPALQGADFLLVNSADLTHRANTALLVSGPSDGAALRAVVKAKSAALLVSTRTEERAGYVDSPLQSGAERIYLGAIGAGAGFAVVAVLLSLLQNAPERTTLLARLRTMGLTRRQGRRLLGLEALPQAVLAAVGGTLVGWATVPLLAPGVDLFRLALATTPGFAPLDSAPLRVDPWSLAVPAVAVVLITAVAAAGQAWWAGRRGSVKELRAGDAR